MLQTISLIVISVLSGIGLLWLFLKTSDQAAVKVTKKRLQARLLEMRLYADDPRVVWSAQKQLLRLNLRYFALMLRPAVVATVPMVLLLIVMDGYYGKQPLELGRPAIVTAQFDHPADAKLEVPPGIEIETPAVRVVSENQVSWRIRPTRVVHGELRLTSDGVTATKSIRAGDGPAYLTSRRVRSLPWLLLYPGEMPLAADGIEWIDVAYPSAGVAVFGLPTWLVWYVMLSMGAAFLLKGKFGVTV